MSPGGKSHYKSRFLDDFLRLNTAMYVTNNALVADPNEIDILTSSPGQWPILEVGLRMCDWSDEAVKYYLLGNPVVWWSGTASLVSFVVVLFWYLVRQKRKIIEFSPGKNKKKFHFYSTFYK